MVLEFVETDEGLEATAKLRAGKFLVRSRLLITENRKRIEITSPYNKDLIAEIKAFDGARYHGYDDNPRKIWSINCNERNMFQLRFMAGEDVYAPYDCDLEEWVPRRRVELGWEGPVPYDHQNVMSSHFWARRWCIAAAEMGTGKTLAAFEVMERVKDELCQASEDDAFWWLGTKSSLTSTQMEIWKWNCLIQPRLMTYEGNQKLMENWQSGMPAPRVVIMDECSKVKNPNAKRSMAAMALANAIRKEYGRDGLIIMMSGSPAPKDPSDWWHLCEIACPGFLREGNVMKFKQRLGLIQKQEGFGGGSYNKLMTWWDDPRKCIHCGQMSDYYYHDPMYCTEDFFHAWEKSENEVRRLYARLKGLVLVLFKKDCLQLPEKVYRIYKCEPSRNILEAAKLVTATAKNASAARALLRELSDGFQYKETKTDRETPCTVCLGNKVTIEYYDEKRPDEPLDSQSLSIGRRVIYNQEGVQVDIEKEPLKIGKREIKCDKCNGRGVTDVMERATVQVPCPKEAALVDLLEDCEEQGRVVIYAGFTGSVDRCVRICREQGWHVIRLDGRGWWSSLQGNSLQLLKFFDLPLVHREGDLLKVAFIGQSDAAGMGLNLTASSVIIYYSNTDKLESRIQSEDRIHRPGADFNRGCTIWDIVHLPSDIKVLHDLRRKKELQSMTLGELKDAITFTNTDELLRSIESLPPLTSVE